MRISDWSSDVCSSDLGGARAVARCDALGVAPFSDMEGGLYRAYLTPAYAAAQEAVAGWMEEAGMTARRDAAANLVGRYEGEVRGAPALMIRSEEHTSELQSLMRNSYAVFCLK